MFYLYESHKHKSLTLFHFEKYYTIRNNKRAENVFGISVYTLMKITFPTCFQYSNYTVKSSYIYFLCTKT